MRAIEMSHDWLKTPLRGQRAFLLDVRHRFIALEGGLGAGKTVAGAWKGWHNHALNAFDEKGEPTFAGGAIIGDTYQNLYRFDVPAFMDVCEEAGVRAVRKSSPPSIHIVEFSTRRRPSVVHLCSADRPERISGFNAGWFWGDEVSRWRRPKSGNPKDDALVQAMGRLRDERVRHQQGIFTYTNEGDGTAVYNFMRARDGQTGEPIGDRAVYVASTRDNVHVRRFLESQLATLSADLVRQYVDGEAINLKGARAYSLFERDEHVADTSLRLSEGMPLTLTLDFNINPGMHALVGQYDRTRDLFVIAHEIHARRMDVRACAARFGELLGDLGGVKRYRGFYIHGDATGRSEWAGTSESCYTVLLQCLDAMKLRRRYCVKAGTSNPPIMDRVHAMQSALKDVHGGVHVAIHPRCRGLIEDMQQTKWDEGGRELDKRQVEVSHFSDALGYWVHRVRPVLLKRRVREGRVALAS